MPKKKVKAETKAKKVEKAKKKVVVRSAREQIEEMVVSRYEQDQVRKVRPAEVIPEAYWTQAVIDYLDKKG
jgi:hypothetical protein